MAWQAALAAGAAALGGSLLEGASGRDQFRMNEDVQKQFAQQGIRWKVNDAKAAGIHPLYALGANTNSFSPVSVGTPNYSGAFGEMGQNITRAIDSTRSKEERLQAQQDADLDREYKRAQIRVLDSQAVANTAAANPALPHPDTRYRLDGQGNSGIKINPSETTVTSNRNPATEAAIAPSAKVFRNRDGSLTVWPSKDAKDSVEDSWYEYEHMYRNRISPFFQDVGRHIYNWTH